MDKFYENIMHQMKSYKKQQHFDFLIQKLSVILSWSIYQFWDQNLNN